ncbi:DEAD/DEAH box helicase [Hamiltosporidium magnivora]|uniref:DEAD/DEAH box helicase n=1 Tax=Hamiltosporidium magnivora TaxID=148818 RepID=A0A4Q9L9G7_9MICR|nr:DEAD/DEAH box helicase [Hamiltosporidium magnivora]
MEDLIEKFSKKFKITKMETKNLIRQSLLQNNYEEEVSNLIGYENMDSIIYICKNRDLFLNTKKEESEFIWPGEEKQTSKYLEYILPTKKSIEINTEELICVSEVGKDHKYFDYDYFNPVQTHVFETAYKTDRNFLVCAPTGAGKTDIALLAILKALKSKNAKIIYIVPMKALATEITKKFQKKLRNHVVSEYTGDTDLTRNDLEISDILICTPEKFDVSTRKLDNILCSSISLIIIDEIHILQDDRGPVIEAIVARIFRFIVLNQKNIRIVGISATLPNYKDVAHFIRAEDVFNFTNEYRPVPLRISIVGIHKQKNNSNIEDTMIELIIEKMNKLSLEKQQLIIFVHSRSETVRTVKKIIKELFNEDFNDRKYNTQNDRKTNKNDKKMTPLLQEFIYKGFGVHHAGLPRNIRLEMESLFRNKKIDVLVSTSTLAWGVNLPAHAVIIKGTTFYDSDRGSFTDLGILDILQIFGRAGRPQYDTYGEAFLFTSSDKLSFYLPQLKNQNLIESNFLKSTVDLLNAEISLGNVNNIEDAIKWIKGTFMYVRMLKNPICYGITQKEYEEGNILNCITEYIVLAAKKLKESKMIEISVSDSTNFINLYSWSFKSTFYGRIASYFYISSETMKEWLEKTDFLFDEESIIRLMLNAKEFSSVILRQDEIFTLKGICTDLNIEYEESERCKLYTLAYCYIKNIPIFHFSLTCDSNFIAKNLQRLSLALERIFLFQNNFILFEKLFFITKKIFKIVKKNEKHEFRVSNIRIGRYLKINIEMDILDKVAIFIYKDPFKDDELIFSDYFSRKTEIFVECNVNEIKIRIIGCERWFESTKIVKIENIDSMKEYFKILYHFGYHSCEKVNWSLFDYKKSCKHFSIIYNQNEIMKNIENAKRNQVFITKKKIDYNFNEIKEKNLDFKFFYYNDSNLEVYLKEKTINLNNIIVFTDISSNLHNFEYFKCFLLSNYKINIELEEVYNENFHEKNKIITSLIFKRSLNIKDNIVIVCSNIHECIKTGQELRIKMSTITDTCIKNYDENYGVYWNTKPFKESKIVLLTLKEAKVFCNNELVIFKGLYDGKNELYNFSEIFRLFDERKIIIYENRNFITFFKSLYNL